jgi:hypothetical protein
MAERDLILEQDPTQLPPEILAILESSGVDISSVSFYKNILFDRNAPYPPSAYGWHSVGKDKKGNMWWYIYNPK